CERELDLCAAGPSSAKATKPEDALQVREPHLDALAFSARLLEGFGANPRPRDISGALIDAAGDPAKRSLGTAPGIAKARGTIPLASEVEERGPVVYDSPARRQGLPRRTSIGVGSLVIAEVLPREGAILALGSVEDRYAIQSPIATVS